MSSVPSSARTSIAGGQGTFLKSLYGSPSHIAVLVKENHASKLAVKLAKSLVRNPMRDQLTLIHVVGTEYAMYAAEEKVLAPLNQDPEYKPCISYKVLVQGEGAGLTELIADAMAWLKPHLLVIGSQGLCNDLLTESEQARRRPGTQPLGSTIRRKPARLATAMRLAQALHQQVPLLLVKDTSIGAFSNANSPGLRCMIDLCSTSRHALDWLLSRLQPARGDSMVLAVAQAVDKDERVRQNAVRLLTTFGVQVAVSPLASARKRLMREASHKALPAAVLADEIDVLVLHAPRSRDLSAQIMDLLVRTCTSVLLWPPDRQADGSTIKPHHPLRAVLDESLPENLRADFQAQKIVAPQLAHFTHQEALLGAGDGFWKGRAPRYMYREQFGTDGQDAFTPLTGALRRSVSDSAHTAFSRMERALARSMTTAESRTVISERRSLREELGALDELDDVPLDFNGSAMRTTTNTNTATTSSITSLQSKVSEKTSPYDHHDDEGAGGGRHDDVVRYDDDNDDDLLMGGPDRQTWPPKAGPLPVQPRVKTNHQNLPFGLLNTTVPEETDADMERAAGSTSARKRVSGGALSTHAQILRGGSAGSGSGSRNSHPRSQDHHHGLARRNSLTSPPTSVSSAPSSSSANRLQRSGSSSSSTRAAAVPGNAGQRALPGSAGAAPGTLPMLNRSGSSRKDKDSGRGAAQPGPQDTSHMAMQGSPVKMVHAAA